MNIVKIAEVLIKEIKENAPKFQLEMRYLIHALPAGVVVTSPDDRGPFVIY